MHVLLLNAGSSSLKASLVAVETSKTVATAHVDWAGEDCRYRYVGPDQQEHLAVVEWRGHAEGVRQIIKDLTTLSPIALEHPDQLLAVGHRVVHGGDFQSAVRITPEVRSRLRALADLAPLHNLPSLNAQTVAEELLPSPPHIAVFDTMFHATIPPDSYTYAIPRAWTEDWGIRRFGFHGLSHAYCSRQAARMLNRPPEQLNLITCHLGHGCSAAAVQRGQCIETTMGFTPLEGLMMATRSGTIDPAIVTFVQQRHGLTPDAVDAALNRQSGLLGVSGISADLREILQAMTSGHQSAKLAYDIYVRRIRQAIGSLAVTLGQIDALIFTAGVGENSARLRADVCQGLECLAIRLDQHLNRQCRPDCDVAAPESVCRVLVMATHEEAEMLLHVRDTVGSR